MILANENGMEFDSVVRERPEKPAYARGAGGTIQPLAFGTLRHDGSARERLGRSRLPTSGSKTASVEASRQSLRRRSAMRDLQAFFVETERASAARMSQVLRDLAIAA